MKRKLTPFVLLSLAALFFLATAALHFYTPSLGAPKNQSTHLNNIKAETEANIATGQKEIEKLSKQLDEGVISFTETFRSAQFPTFIFKDDQLVFWSDHAVVPDLEYLKYTTKITAVNSEYGTFLVLPYYKGNYKMYVCLLLKTDFPDKTILKYPHLKNEILQDFNLSVILDSTSTLPKVYHPENNFLFAVDLNVGSDLLYSKDLKLIFLTLGSFFYILFSLVLFNRLSKKGKALRGGIVLLVLLIAARFLLLILDLPFAISEAELFDSHLYAASFWSPSVGDMALNVILFLAIAVVSFKIFRKEKILTKLKALDNLMSRVYIVSSILLFFFLLIVLYQFFHGIYHNSPLILDITQSLEFDKYKVIIYGVMAMHTFALCIFTYLLSTIVTVLLQNEKKLWPFKVMAIIATLSLGISFVLATEFLIIIFVGTIFWAIIIVSAYNTDTVSFPYRTYLFFFIVFMVSALIGAFALYAHHQNELKIYKQKFAYNLLQDNDVLGEYLLEDIADKISSDALIQRKMLGPYVDSRFIKRKISKQYLKDYFNKYETNVLLFDSQGQSLESSDSTAVTLQELLNKYKKPETKTERPNLFLIKDPTRYNARTYYQLVHVPISTSMKGTIVLQLTLKRMLPHSLVPELLNDQQQNNQPFRIDLLSFAIYDHDKLSYSEGEYDYATYFDPIHIGHSEFYIEGHNQGEYHHYGIPAGKNKVLVVTNQKYSGREILSNFSFMFLVYIGGFICLGLIVLLFRRNYIKEFRPNFSTKIQVFLNFGILLPLLLISIAITSLVTASYKKDLMTTYEQRGKAIQENFNMIMGNGELESKRELQKYVSEIAAISETDINIYDRGGNLVTTSQPLIFETGLLSKLINPQAYAAISERQALRVLLEEQAGNLTFNSVYLPLRINNNLNSLSGFIGIPFFDSEKELDLKLIELITTTMNIFTIMFIMFMVLTFFASRALTVPLRMLAGKLKHTSLTGKNEMLAYEGADEIGMLVNEYNRMLLTLEQNKEDLAMQEKEAAWREMARQVAHEIKNPLTPMKLSLQYLQKAIAENNPNTEKLIEKISHTLITQINILSDIATSFSSFTSMPEPKKERINISAALKKSADLHNDPTTAVIQTDIDNSEVFVIADENLMVRTFNNLLLNAIQAVPANRKPFIKISLHIYQGNSVNISIKDNGAGIPEEIKKKVFIPNFSTKYSGSGIGLAVAKKGIENSGGSIWFESEKGKGTTFYISLPLAEA